MNAERIDALLANADLPALIRAIGETDFFSLLGLPREFDVDEAAMRRWFLAISRRIHPDAVGGDDAAQAQSMRAAARVNAAYETLRDPVRRAEYVLELSGGKTAAQDKRVPQEVLTQTLMLREEIEEARVAGDTATAAAMKPAVLKQKSDTEQRIADVARRLLREPDDALRDELRLRLNAMKYVQNLIMQM